MDLPEPLGPTSDELTDRTSSETSSTGSEPAERQRLRTDQDVASGNARLRVGGRRFGAHGIDLALERD